MTTDESLIERDIYGFKLTHETVPPEAFPAETGLHYFRLDRTDPPGMWQLVEAEGGIAARWRQEEAPELTLTLCMTVP